MACFADITASEGSVATYARCGGIFNIHFSSSRLVLLESLAQNLVSLLINLHAGLKLR